MGHCNMSVQRCTCTDTVSVQRMQRSDMYEQCRIKYFLKREATRSAVLPKQVVRPSVCPSVYLPVTLRYRGHIGWNSWKIISRLIRLTFSLSENPNMTDQFQREHNKI